VSTPIDRLPGPNTGSDPINLAWPNSISVDVQRIDEAAVIGGDGLHGLEIGEEGGPSELLERHQALAEDHVFTSGELEGRPEDIHQEVEIVGRAIAHDAGVGADVGAFALIRGDGGVELRADEVLAAAQQQRDDGRRVGVRGGGGSFRVRHMGRPVGLPAADSMSNSPISFLSCTILGFFAEL